MTSTKQGVTAYPGYDSEGSYATPRPAPRVKPEAEEFARKSGGSLNLFATTPRFVESPRVEPKCPSEDARRNYELGRHGSVSSLLNGSATPRPDSTCASRVKPEAEGIASNNSGKNTADLLYKYGNGSQSERPVPRIKVEAEEAAKVHTGGRMNCLLHSPGRLPTSSRPAPRVKPDAEVTASLEGMQMGKILNRYAQGPLSNRPVPRVKQEASLNAEKSKGNEMTCVFGTYGNNTPDDQPAARVKDEAKGFADLDKGGRISRLMHEGSKMRRSPRPPPRATTSAARNIMKAHRGQMGNILAAQSQKLIVSLPGTRSYMTKTI